MRDLMKKATGSISYLQLLEDLTAPTVTVRVINHVTYNGFLWTRAATNTMTVWVLHMA